ncbi:MAG: hemerythrin domain-containing protein [Oligoflexales bacterium]
MNIYEGLTNDHNKIKGLLERLVVVSDKDNDFKAILDQINDLLIPHARAEEAVFYNTLRETDEGKDVVMHGYEEHLQAETLLRTLQGLEKINVEWTAAAKKLKEAVLHHIEEEEEKVFAAARIVFSEEEAEQLLIPFQKVKDIAREQGDFKNTMDLIRNIMPQRFRKSGETSGIKTAS